MDASDGIRRTSSSSTDWSTAVHSLLDQPPATLPQRLVLGGTIFCLAFGAWAWLGKIEEIGQARGQLVPQGQTYKIQPLELSQVSRILVEEGEAVKAGQVLAELHSELAREEVDRLEQGLETSLVELDQKQDLLARTALESRTQAAIAAADIKAQRSAIALARQQAETTRQLLAQQQGEVRAYQQRKVRLQPLAAIASERMGQLQEEAAAHRERIARLKPLKEEGIVSEESIFQAEQALRQTQKEIGQNRLTEIMDTREQVFQGEQALRELEGRMTQNQGELAASLKERDRLQAELAQKQAQATKAQQEAQTQIQQLQVEITQTTAKIKETRSMLASAKEKLKYKYLKAPVDGTVLSLDLENAGEVIEAGKVVAEIAPHGVPLVVSAILPNQEAGFVREGMPVNVKLDAYPYQDYGVIDGRVTNISADAEPDEELGLVYRVEVELDQDYVVEDQQQVAFKPGQAATAEIIIRSRRIIDLLLDPIKQMQAGGINL